MEKKLAIVSVSVLLLALPVAALALNPLTWFQTLITNFLNIVVWPVFLGVSLIMFLYAGFMFVTANGDPGKVATAQKAVIWAVVGIIVVILGYGAVATIRTIIPS